MRAGLHSENYLPVENKHEGLRSYDFDLDDNGGDTVPARAFRANEVRLQLSVLAYNLGNLWRRLVLPKRIDHWSLTSLHKRLGKTGGRFVNMPGTIGCCWPKVI